MARVAEEGKAELVREENNRGQLRAERERLASILVPLVMLASAALVAVLALSNARERRGEIGILRAIGVRSRKVLLLFLSKAVVVGVGGGAIGCIAGYFAGRYLGAGLDHAGARAAFEPIYAGLALGVAPVLAAVASWIPAMLASQQEPAVILREE
jgi:putative ABC transport system permease protein